MTALDQSAVPRMPRGVRLHDDRVRGITVLLAPERALKLDPVGAAILGEVDGARSVSAIAATLAARFDAPAERIEADARDFLAGLIDRRMLEVDR